MFVGQSARRGNVVGLNFRYVSAKSLVPVVAVIEVGKDVEFFDILKSLLDKLGYHIVEYHSYVEAARDFVNVCPNLVICNANVSNVVERINLVNFEEMLSKSGVPIAYMASRGGKFCVEIAGYLVEVTEEILQAKIRSELNKSVGRPVSL